MKFEDPRLEEIYINSQPAIERHLKNLASINADIKALENLLNSMAVTDCYNYLLSGTHGNLCFGGAKRIFYVEREENGEICFERPLIECSAAIRLKAGKALPLFLEWIIKKHGEQS